MPLAKHADVVPLLPFYEFPDLGRNREVPCARAVLIRTWFKSPVPNFLWLAVFANILALVSVPERAEMALPV